MKLIVTLLAALLTASNAANAWVKGQNLCVGVDKDCTSPQTCSKTMIGPCDSGKASASAYLIQEVDNVAFVKADTYLDAILAKKNTSAEVLAWTSTADGYLDRGCVDDSGIKYCFTQTGNLFGASEAWAYAGVSSYFNNGNKTLESATSIVYTVDDFAKKSRTDRSATKLTADTPSDSKYGAPAGPYKPCIAPMSGSKCGDAIKYEPDAYKYNIFMHFQGTTAGVEQALKNAKAKVAYTHVGVRQKLSVVGAKVTSVQVNDAAWDKSKVNQNVKSFTLKFENGQTVRVVFPSKYNTGTTEKMTPVATKDIQIRMVVMEGYAHVDYLFEAADVKKGHYLIFDPTITDERTYPDGKGAGGNSAVSAAVSAGVLAMLALLF
jgi:hypothetical protein